MSLRISHPVLLMLLMMLIFLCEIAWADTATTGHQKFVPNRLVFGSNKSNAQPVVINNIQTHIVAKLATKLEQARQKIRNRLAATPESKELKRQILKNVLSSLEQSFSNVRLPDGSKPDFVEPDYIDSLTPNQGRQQTHKAQVNKFNDPLYSDQWGLRAIGVPALHARLQGKIGANMVIAHLDTGAAIENHGIHAKSPDFVDMCIVDKYDFVNNDDVPNDDNGHGSHTLSTMAETTNNAVGGAGVVTQSCFAVYKVLNAQGSGSHSNVAKAIRRAADRGYQIISMSLGGNDSQTKRSAVEYALSKGVIISASAGNNGNSEKTYPAAYEGVISVISLDSNLSKSSFSTYGRWATVSAPGRNIVQYSIPLKKNCFTLNCFQRVSLNGTSMAQPFVAATIATWISEAQRIGKDLTRKELLKIIASSSQDLGAPGKDSSTGHGLIRVDKGLDLILEPPSAYPKVVITSPEKGGTYSGIIQLSGQVTDDEGVSNVKYTMDGKDLRFNAQAIDSMEWDSRSTENGEHTFAIIASDSHGQITTTSITFNTNNGITPQPSPKPSPKPQPTPEPQPEPQPAPESTKIHLESLTFSVKKVGKYCHFKSLSLVTDQNNNAVSKAKVYIRVSGPRTVILTGYTNQKGLATASKRKRCQSVNGFKANVMRIKRSGMTYDPKANKQ